MKWKSKDLGGKMVEYKLSIGIRKSIKNVAITVGIPALVVLLNNYTQWMPKSWYNIAVPLISLVSYMIKNFVQVKSE